MDWRKGSSCLPELMSNFYNRGPLEYTDITFNLPDGTQVSAHKFLLAIASQFFEAQFYGVFATSQVGVMEILEGVGSKCFRRIIDFIYNCKALDWSMERMEYWELLEAANLYLVPGLIEHCEGTIVDFIKNPINAEEAVININKAYEMGYGENIYKSGLVAIKNDLATFIKEDALGKDDAWGKVKLNIVLDIMADVNLNVKEGELFKAMIKWCRANASSEEESMKLFQEKFVEKVMVQNISHECFHHFVETTNYLSSEMKEDWKQQVMKNRAEIGTRKALIPLRMVNLTIEGKDLTNPPKEAGGYSTLQQGALEFTNVHVKWGVMISKDKKQVLLNTSHYPKQGFTKNAITERVTVKIVIKKQDGTIVKEVAKMVEDKEFTGTFERRRGINRQFVISSTPDERLDWDIVECSIAIDRRPRCTIRAISEADYCESVCTSQSNAYIDQARPFEFNASTSISEVMKMITGTGHVCSHHMAHDKHTQWLYTNKGFASNLESWNNSSRIDNDGRVEDWAPETMGDFMRLTAHSDSASKFNTWVTAKDVTVPEKVRNMLSNIKNLIAEKDPNEVPESIRQLGQLDKKTLFLCSYNPQNKKIKFLRTVNIPVRTKKVATGMDPGTINVNDELINLICDDFKKSRNGAKPSKIFLRRVSPDEDESDPKVQESLTSELVKGEPLTNVDNCHVIVLQENAPGIDYDQFILNKIREIKFVFKPIYSEGASYHATLDSESLATDVIGALSQLSKVPVSDIRVFECYSGKNIVQRPAEFPIHSASETKLGEMFNHCKENIKTLFYEVNLTARVTTNPEKVAKTSEDADSRKVRRTTHPRKVIKDSSDSRKDTKTSANLHKLVQNRSSLHRCKQTSKDVQKIRQNILNPRTRAQTCAAVRNTRSSKKSTKGPLHEAKLVSQIPTKMRKLTKTRSNLHKLVKKRTDLRKFKRTLKDSTKLRQNLRTRAQTYEALRKTRSSSLQFIKSRAK